jgi:hypothetical protein
MVVLRQVWVDFLFVDGSESHEKKVHPCLVKYRHENKVTPVHETKYHENYVAVHAKSPMTAVRPCKVTCGYGPSTQSHAWLQSVHQKVTWWGKVAEGVTMMCGGKRSIG